MTYQVSEPSRYHALAMLPYNHVLLQLSLFGISSFMLSFSDVAVLIWHIKLPIELPYSHVFLAFHIIVREIIIAPPIFCFMFIQPLQNFNMYFAQHFFLHLYQLTTFALTLLNNFNKMTILPPNKLKDYFILQKLLK